MRFAVLELLNAKRIAINPAQVTRVMPYGDDEDSTVVYFSWEGRSSKEQSDSSTVVVAGKFDDIVNTLQAATD
jgi:hypothetical protein